MEKMISNNENNPLVAVWHRTVKPQDTNTSSTTSSRPTSEDQVKTCQQSGVWPFRSWTLINVPARIALWSRNSFFMVLVMLITLALSFENAFSLKSWANKTSWRPMWQYKQNRTKWNLLHDTGPRTDLKHDCVTSHLESLFCLNVAPVTITFLWGKLCDSEDSSWELSRGQHISEISLGKILKSFRVLGSFPVVKLDL